MIALLTDRCLITIALAGVGLLAYGNSKDSAHTGLPHDSFWRAKMAMVGTADVVACGDSRVYRGVDPDGLSSSGEFDVVVNFGFSGVGFSADYLEATRGILSASGSKVIVLGITPHSLTPSAVARNGFNDYRPWYGKPLRAWQIRIAEYKETYAPIRFQTFRNALSSTVDKPTRLKTHYFQNGFAARPASGFDERMNAKTLQHYRSIFESNKVSDSLVSGVFEFCRDCQSHGILVAGFRPPTTDEMEAIENSSSGFSEPEFVSAFEQAGGLWLDIQTDDLGTFDSSHLDAESAIVFSRRIGDALKIHLEKRERE